MTIERDLFDSDHEVFRNSVRKWCDGHIAPHSESWIEAGVVSREVWKAAGDAGYLAMYAEEEFGGSELDDFRYDQILIEEISRYSSGFFLPLHNRIVGPYFHRFATVEQKQRFMPGIVSGEKILAIAITEPGTGSDMAGIRTRAEVKDDHWVLNGAKTYISNGLISDVVLVVARTHPENPHAMGLFIVEAGMEGFKRGKKLKKLGLHAQDTAELFFDDVKIPKANVLGDPLQGFRYMISGLAEERLAGAVAFMARAERAFEITMAFIKERKVFGKPVGTFQNSRFKMAEMRSDLDMGWVFTDHCTKLHLQGKLSAEVAAEAKLKTSEIEARVVDECLQLHGGAGYMDEYEISRLYADARVSRIYAGTSEIMKEIIGRGLGLDDRAEKSQ